MWNLGSAAFWTMLDNTALDLFCYRRTRARVYRGISVRGQNWIQTLASVFLLMLSRWEYHPHTTQHERWSALKRVMCFTQFAPTPLGSWVAGIRSGRGTVMECYWNQRSGVSLLSRDSVLSGPTTTVDRDYIFRPNNVSPPASITSPVGINETDIRSFSRVQGI